MTLMPVSNIWVLDSSWSKAGAERWMPQRSLTSRVWPGSRLRQSPVVLKTLPRVTSPTGTVIGPPVSCTAEPRTRPSVGCREMARTMLSPMCWATSRLMFFFSPESSTVVVSRLYCSGISPTGNSTSTTGPMMREIRPTPPATEPAVPSVTVAVISWFPSYLASARTLARRELGGRGLQQAVEEAGGDVLRQQGVEHLLGRRLELVEREHVVRRRGLLALDDLEGQEADDLGLLRHHVDEPGEHDVDLVQAALLVAEDEVGDDALTDLAGRLEGRAVGEAAPLGGELAATELVEARGLATDEVGHDLLALVPQLLGEPLALLQHGGGVGAGQAAVAGDDHDARTTHRRVLRGERVVDVGVRRDGRDRPGERPRVRAGFLDPLLGLHHARGRDELHRARDLLGRLDGPDALAVDPHLRSHSFPPLLSFAAEVPVWRSLAGRGGRRGRGASPAVDLSASA